MSLIVVTILWVGGLVAAAILALAVPALLGLMAYDTIKSREVSVERIEDVKMRIATERTFARGFVVLGGAFWSVAAFAGLYSFRESGLSAALMAAMVPLVAIAVTLIIGWYYERVVAALLALASVAVVAWGTIYQFEIGVWFMVGVFLIGPMLTAATLFWLARRDQDALELAIKLSLDQPQLVPVRSA
ncbi:MAG: hypothetical protein U1E29_07460 [Coriobacteriia bacterium]|nr:hypothetical protein [Coriobacteriia bacterium]